MSLLFSGDYMVERHQAWQRYQIVRPPFGVLVVGVESISVVGVQSAATWRAMSRKHPSACDEFRGCRLLAFRTPVVEQRG